MTINTDETMEVLINGTSVKVLLYNYRERMAWHPKVQTGFGDIYHYPFHIAAFQMRREALVDKGASPMKVYDGKTGFWADWALEYHNPQSVGSLDRETGMAFGIKQRKDFKPIMFWPHGELFLLEQPKFVDWAIELFIKLSGGISADRSSVVKMIDHFYNENYIGTRLAYDATKGSIDNAPIVGGVPTMVGGNAGMRQMDAFGEQKGIKVLDRVF